MKRLIELLDGSESRAHEDHMKITILQGAFFAGAGIAEARSRKPGKPSVRLLPNRGTKSPMFQGFVTACLQGKRSERSDIFVSGGECGIRGVVA